MIRRTAGALALVLAWLCATFSTPAAAQTAQIRNANGVPYEALLGCDGVTPQSQTNPLCTGASGSSGSGAGVDANGQAGVFNNPAFVLETPPIVVIYTIPAGQTGLMTPTPFSPVYIGKYKSATCVVTGYPTGWTANTQWVYQESYDPSPNGTYYQIVGDSAQYSGAGQYSFDTNANPRTFAVYGRWFNINVSSNSGTSGALTIECDFSQTQEVLHSLAVNLQLNYNTARTTTRANGAAFTPTADLMGSMNVVNPPSIDPNSAIAAQNSSALENCHEALTYASGYTTAGAQNFYAANVVNTDTVALWAWVYNAAACPSSGTLTLSGIGPAILIPAASSAWINPTGPPTRYSAGVAVMLSTTAPPVYTPPSTAYGKFSIEAY